MNSLVHLLLGLSFLVLCSRACNPGWTEYDGNCYQVPMIYNVDIRMARRYCMFYGGDLAYINNTNTLDFIQNLPDYDGHYMTYWIREDSHTEPSAPSVVPIPNHMNSCAYSFITIQYGDCDKKRRFICEMENPSENMYCPPNWYTYGQTCYKMMPMLANYTASVTICSVLHSQLAILDDLTKEHQSFSVIIGQNKTFMVDAKRINGTFKWSNGKDFQPNCVDCVQHSDGDCLGYKSDTEHPMQVSWVYLNCSSPNNFLCVMDATVLKAATTTTTQTPSTTSIPTTTPLAPLQCPIGFNWRAHEESGFCYWETTYEADKLNWHQARAFCQAYGGDLASYQNEEQERHGLGGAVGHIRGLWFGLERSQNNNFHWVDGSPLTYTNWGYQSHYESRSKFCVMHGSTEGKWELDYCGVRRWFICKSPLVRNPTLPDLDNLFKKTPCHVSNPSVYHQWFLYKDHCYLVHEDPRYSWGMAHNFCNDNGAQLASIHSFAETDFILQLASISSNSDYWIGLSSFGLGSSRTWSDNTPVDFLYWDDGYEPFDQNGLNSCVTFNKHRGFWQIEHCNRFQQVICKRRFNSSVELTTPQPTPLLPGNCEKGWYSLGNQCYKTFGEKWSKRIMWREAKDICERSSASLVSIHTKEQQDFLTDMVLNLGCDAWIGLQSLDRGTTYEWSDDTPLDYVNWDVNEPAHSNIWDDDPYLSMSPPVDGNSCIKLSLDATSVGNWKDVACSYKNAYICQKPKNATITEPTENLFECSNITGWNRLGSSCYGFFNETASWMDAQRKCRTFGADLVSFRNSAASVFLQKRLSRQYQFFWTGIRLIAENQYVFLNGQRLLYTNWLRGQPKKVSNLMDNCVAMNLDARWVVRNCKENFPYVCEWNPDGEKTEGIIEKRHTCPNISEWEDIGTDTCYLFNLDHRLVWDDAMTYCFRHGGHLASLHSPKEAELVRQHIVDNTAASFVHIGLGKRRDGSYGWVDNTPFDYVQWDEDEPQQNGYDCVQLFIRNGKLRTSDCDRSLRGFICSSTRDSNVGAASTDDTIVENVVGQKLAVGGFIGIAICVIVVFAIASVTAYHLCPYTRMRVSLLDSP